MIAAPGSSIWLLRHEIRLFWRGMARRGGGGRARRIWLTIALPLILMVTAGLPLGFALRRVHQVPITPAAGLIAAVVLVALFTLMLSQTWGRPSPRCTSGLTSTSCSPSPLAPRRVLAVRFLAVSVNVFAIFAMLATPILLPIAVMGHPTWLAALVVLFCVALAASGVGLLLAAALFRLIGPRAHADGRPGAGGDDRRRAS